MYNEQEIKDNSYRLKKNKIEVLLDEIGCRLELLPCSFYGKKRVYFLKVYTDPINIVHDGFDTTYEIERISKDLFSIQRICIGGFAGLETKEQIFLGYIKNKKILLILFNMLGISLNR